jgi:signal transduction histidine kinase
MKQVENAGTIDDSEQALHESINRLDLILSTMKESPRSDGFLETWACSRDLKESKIMEERLSALNLYGRKLNSANSFQEVYELTLDAMEQTLGFEQASFLVVDGDRFQIVGSRGYPSRLNLVLPLDGSKGGITVKSVNTCKPILISDTMNDEGYVEGVPGVRSELAVPVMMKDEAIGVLNVECKKIAAFNEKDMTLLQILASHAATAIRNLEMRDELKNRSNQLSLLMENSTKMMGATDIHQRLQTVAEAIMGLGWRRVVISVRGDGMEIESPEDIVTAGLTEEEVEFLWERRPPGQVWRERFGPQYDRFKIGEFYHLPWSDPWVRKKFSDTTIESKLEPEEMVDWDPQDLLYAPLRLADGHVVGVVSIDDPLDGRRPTKESMAPLELFIHQAAVAIENALLIKNLHEAREQLKTDAELLELKVQERTEELRESQIQLLRAQRLIAMGELARMVGHDLRNPLTGIAGATYYLKSRMKSREDGKIKEMLRLIEQDIEYSNKIINDLLEYSGEIQLEFSEFALKPLIEEALSLVKIPKNVKITCSTKRSLKILADPEKMKRVFVNIIKNAVDAMPNGGKLKIWSEKSDGHIATSFSDTGPGISEDVLEKIWVPLFTTKAKGMGLGLSIVNELLKPTKARLK